MWWSVCGDWQPSPGDWAQRTHLAVWVFAALGMAVQLAPVYATIDRLSGIPNLALLVCALLTFTSGWWVQIFYLFVTQPRPHLRAEIGRRVWLLLGACALETVLFVLIDAREEVGGVGSFRARYGDSPAVFALSIVVYSWAGLVFWNIARLWRHFARLSARPMSRLGYVQLAAWPALRAELARRGVTADGPALAAPTTRPRPGSPGSRTKAQTRQSARARACLMNQGQASELSQRASARRHALISTGAISSDWRAWAGATGAPPREGRRDDRSRCDSAGHPGVLRDGLRVGCRRVRAALCGRRTDV